MIRFLTPLRHALSSLVNPSSSILVGQIGQVFWIRVEGRGTFQNSLQLKQVLQSTMADGLHRFVLDLERCPMMDSTFLGTLTGAALRLREVNEGSLSVLNSNERNEQLLESLGLDHLLDVDREGTSWPEERRIAIEQLSKCRQEGATENEDQTEHVLEAHQALADVSDDNACRFKDVIVFLQKEVAAHRSAS